MLASGGFVIGEGIHYQQLHQSQPPSGGGPSSSGGTNSTKYTQGWNQLHNLQNVTTTLINGTRSGNIVIIPPPPIAQKSGPLSGAHYVTPPAWAGDLFRGMLALLAISVAAFLILVKWRN
jgi:hypothetical protein